MLTEQELLHPSCQASYTMARCSQSITVFGLSSINAHPDHI